MFITKLGAGRKRQEEKLPPVFLPFTAEPTLIILLYSSFMGFFFNLFPFSPSISIFLMYTDEFFTSIVDFLDSKGSILPLLSSRSSLTLPAPSVLGVAWAVVMT